MEFYRFEGKKMKTCSPTHVATFFAMGNSQRESQLNQRRGRSAEARSARRIVIVVTCPSLSVCVAITRIESARGTMPFIGLAPRSSEVAAG